MMRLDTYYFNIWCEKGVIAAYFPLEAIEWVPRELAVSDRRQIHRSQEVTVQWDPIQNALNTQYAIWGHITI
jgi:hypothetical protein